MKIESTLNDDKSIAQVTIAGRVETMTAAHVEDAMRRLVAIRAEMTPAVSEELVLQGEFQVSFDPRWFSTGHGMGGVLLHIRNSGSGWSHMCLSPQSATALATILNNGVAALTGKLEPDPNVPGSMQSSITIVGMDAGRNPIGPL